MQRLFFGTMLLLAGCQNVVGPFGYRQPQRIDDPRLTIAEQQRLGRNRLALPDDSPAVGPPTGLEYPGSHPQ